MENNQYENTEHTKKVGMYSKRPLWQWIIFYVIIAGIVYGIVYYVIRGRSTSYSSASQTQNSVAQQVPSY